MMTSTSLDDVLIKMVDETLELCWHRNNPYIVEEKLIMQIYRLERALSLEYMLDSPKP